jgi:hypothetical protein
MDFLSLSQARLSQTHALLQRCAAENARARADSQMRDQQLAHVRAQLGQLAQLHAQLDPQGRAVGLPAVPHDAGSPAPAGAATIMLKIRLNDTVTQFRIKRSTPMAKLFAAFHGKINAAQGSYTFMVDGETLSGFDTADTRLLEDGAQIEACPIQYGD